MSYVAQYCGNINCGSPVINALFSEGQTVILEKIILVLVLFIYVLVYSCLVFNFAFSVKTD